MERTTLLYVLAFLLILGGGAALIIPMLQPPVAEDWETATGKSTREGSEVSSTDDSSTDGAEDGASNASAQTSTSWTKGWPDLQVTVTRDASTAAASGELKIYGAELGGVPQSNATGWTVDVRPSGEAIWMAGPSSAWTSTTPAQLLDEPSITLAPASPPIEVALVEADGTPAAFTPFVVRPGPADVVRRTNESGKALLHHMPQGLIWLSASTMERAGESKRVDTTQTHRVTLVLEPAWHIRGKAVDDSGAPVVGATVRVIVPGAETGRSTTTNDGGVFDWRGPAAARVALEVKRKGFVGRRIAVTPPAVGPLITDVGLIPVTERGFRLEGRVVGLDAGACASDDPPYVEIEPAAAAVVADIFGAGHVVSLPTRRNVEPDGSFAVDDLPATISLRVSLRGAGVDVDVRTTGAVGQTTTLELAAVSGETLRGTVLRPDGEPAAGQVLLISHEPRDGDAVQADDVRVMTDAAGRFFVSGIVEARVFVRGYRNGCRSLLETIDLAQETPFTFRMEAALTDESRRVSGTVRDDEGKPLGGVRVQVAGVRTTTAEDGTYTLDGVESLAPLVLLSAGYPLAQAIHGGESIEAFSSRTLSVQPGSTGVDLSLPRSARLKMRLLDGIDDTPITFLHVVVQATKGGAVLVDRGMALAGGELDLGGLSPTTVHLSLMTHKRRLSKSIHLKRGKTLDLRDVLMPRGLRITGVVTGKGDKPLVGATVGALDAAWQTRGSDISKERDLLFRSTVTDSKGRYELEGLDPAEAAQLAFCAVDYAPRAKQIRPPSDIAKGMTVTSDVKLSHGAYLVLELSHESAEGRGHGVFGALVDLENARDGSDYLDVVHWGALGGPVCSSDGWRRASDLLLMEQEQDGLYIAGPLQPGPYDLIVYRPGYERMHRRLTVMEPGAVITRNVLQQNKPQLFARSTRFRFEMKPTR